jgi:SAM-dependent methyltransferase
MPILTSKAHTIKAQFRRQGWLRLPDNPNSDQTVKPLPYLPIYERLLAPMRGQTFAMLELGVWQGHSLTMWRDAFPRATIVGVDLTPPSLDLGPRVHIVRGDQTDAELMQRIRSEHAPNGFDVIIDDASHFGVTTARSLQTLYNDSLRPGGLYCIEDWGTGYMPVWPDGGPLANPLDIEHLDSTQVPFNPDASRPIPMHSHDIGMVGLVKRLIDHVASSTARSAQPEAVGDILAIESLDITEGIVALRKPAA